MKNVKYVITTYSTLCISLVVIFFFASCLIVSHDTIFSSKENRVLQTLPKISVQAVSDNTFQSKFSAFLSDQFYLRSSWVSAKTNIEHSFGKNNFNDVTIGKDDYLFQNVVIPSSKQQKELATVMNSFTQQYKDVTFSMILVPNKSTVLQDKLPILRKNQDQTVLISDFYSLLDKKIKRTDAVSALKKAEASSFYYRSDHHWTMDGAFSVFQEYKRMMIPNGKDMEYDHYLVSDSFHGTLANTSGFYGESDIMTIYTPKTETVNIVNYVEEQEKSTTLYDVNKVNSSNPYDIYLGGNHPFLKIETNSTKDKRLLVLKDSFANCFIPFLVPYYNEIYVIDPRYYYDDVNALMKENNISDVLFLYNANTFFSDSSLLQTLEN